MITYKQFQKALNTVKKYQAQEEARVNKINTEVSSALKFLNLDTILYDTNISVRLLNILQSSSAEQHLGIRINGSTKIKEFSKISISKFMKIRNSGKKSLKELQEFCTNSGITLLP